MKVPAGVEDGMRIRLSGQGEVGPGGGPAGDLYVEIHELPHDIFTREGDDLHCRVQLPMTAAALGTTLTLTTLDGDEDDRRAAGHPAGHGGPAARPRRAAPARGRPRRPARARPGRDADPAGRGAGGAAAEFAELRGEDMPVSTRGHGGGLFSKMRDAFNGR